MEQSIYFLLFGLGLIMIIKGSDWFINTVIWISTVFKIPHIIIGATVVSICTSLPETFVSATAALKGETDLAFGNAMGSIAINTGLIMAILFLFAKSTIIDRKDFIKNGLLLIFTLVLILAFGLIYGEISRSLGFVLFGFFILYIISNFLSARRKVSESIAGKEDSKADVSRKAIVRSTAYFFIGITLVISGSYLIVENGIKIAEFLKIPTILIAITFTSLGTSLPELVTTVSSIRKGVANLGVGNIIGANILNIIQAISISSIIKSIPLLHDPSILYFQLPLVLIIISTPVIFSIFYKTGFRRWHGLVLLCLYLVFLTANLMREKTPILGPIFFGS